MMKSISILFLFINGLSSEKARGQFTNPNAKTKRIGLDIIRHAPCKYAEGRSPLLIFPDSNSAPAVPIFDSPGCYSLKGDVHVNTPIVGTLQLYVEQRSRPTDERPLTCNGYDSTGCGGIGSCVYCNTCHENLAHAKKLAQMSIIKNGKELSCHSKNDEPLLDVGTHEDVELRFCMPTQEDFAIMNGWDEETFNSILEGHKEANTVGKETVFLTIYVFNTDLVEVAQQQRRIIERMKKTRDDKLVNDWRQTQSDNERLGLPVDELSKPVTGLPIELTDEDFENLPLNKAVHHMAQYISCHKVYANLYYDSDDAPNPFAQILG